MYKAPLRELGGLPPAGEATGHGKCYHGCIVVSQRSAVPVFRTNRRNLVMCGVYLDTTVTFRAAGISNGIPRTFTKNPMETAFYKKPAEKSAECNF